MKFMLLQKDKKELENYKVKASDRAYQFWERNALSVELWSRPVFMQKLNYIPIRTGTVGHDNPTTPCWKLCQVPEEYRYSSANFYETGIDDFGLLTHYSGIQANRPTHRLQVITSCNGQRTG